MPARLFPKICDEYRGVRMEFICTNHIANLGELRIYEVARPEHEDGSRGLRGLFRDLGPAIDVTVRFRGEAIMSVNGNVYMPDESMFPRGRSIPGGPFYDANGSQFPTIVIECAHSESDIHAERKALEWVGPHTTVQECWVVRRSCPRGWTAGRMRIKRYIRGALLPPYEREFGTVQKRGYAGAGARVICNAPGMAIYIIEVPAATIWHGVGTRRGGAGWSCVAAWPAGLPILTTGVPCWALDLFKLQQLLLD